MTRAYPLPLRSPAEDDPRFSVGLTRDVTHVLERHGYPPLEPDDVVALRQALFRFLYHEGWKP